MKLAKPVAAALLACAAAGPFSAQAASLADLGFSQAQINTIRDSFGAPAGEPGTTFGSPGAYGASWGQIGIGVGGATISNNKDQDEDGSASLVFGLGDPAAWVGLETVVNAISMRDEFGEDGSVDFKLHHQFVDQQFAVAIGAENVINWGRPDDLDIDPSYYAVVTKRVDLGVTGTKQVPLAVNFGVGNERFVDGYQFEPSGVNAFGGIAVGVLKRTTWIVDWTGVLLNSALSVAPFRNVPLTITAGAVNLNERDGADVEFAGGIGYTYIFR